MAAGLWGGVEGGRRSVVVVVRVGVSFLCAPVLHKGGWWVWEVGGWVVLKVSVVVGWMMVVGVGGGGGVVVVVGMSVGRM